MPTPGCAGHENFARIAGSCPVAGRAAGFRRFARADLVDILP
jgi:hypothetical protein